MSGRAHFLWMLLTSSAGIFPAGQAIAQSRTLADGPPATAARETPTAERARLRAQLGRLQAEIDRLKSGEPGLRSDYVLRARLADAEAVARRLTELDAQLKARPEPGASHAPTALAPAVRDEPVASPTDGPTELEAKADILADQARRTQVQAVALETRIDQMHGRRELHRRARDLENDPFAPLEGSRRRLAPGSPNVKADTAVYSPTGVRGGGTNTVTATPAPGLGSTGAIPSSTTPATMNPAVQVHDVLDPSTPAQVRRADAAPAVPGDLESMQRALAVLKARAQHLDAQAKALRAQARTR